MTAFDNAIAALNLALFAFAGEAVTYTPRHGDPFDCKAIRVYEPTDAGLGPKGSARKRLIFDISTVAKPGRPAALDRITAVDGDWLVKVVPDFPEDGVWRLVVEAAGAR